MKPCSCSAISSTIFATEFRLAGGHAGRLRRRGLAVRALVARPPPSEGAGRLKDAGARLAFPLTGGARPASPGWCSQQFIHVNLLKLAMPLLGSMALVRAVVFVLRQAFPQATWLTAWERIIATFIWGWLALYITDLAPDVIDVLEDVVFHARQAAPQPVDGARRASSPSS
jgi:hypothetical protein